MYHVRALCKLGGKHKFDDQVIEGCFTVQNLLPLAISWGESVRRFCLFSFVFYSFDRGINPVVRISGCASREPQNCNMLASPACLVKVKRKDIVFLLGSVD
jgi:hypothetical protein